MKIGLAFILVVLITITLSGCVMVAAQLAESEKVKQDFDLPYTRLLEATKEALNSLQIGFDKEGLEGDTVKISARYADGSTVHIVILRTSNTESSIEIRVGTSEAGKKAAQDILTAIKRSLL